MDPDPGVDSMTDVHHIPCERCVGDPGIARRGDEYIIDCPDCDGGRKQTYGFSVPCPLCTIRKAENLMCEHCQTDADARTMGARHLLDLATLDLRNVYADEGMVPRLLAAAEMLRGDDGC